MKKQYHTLYIYVALLLLFGLPACDFIHDGELPPCDFKLRFVYDYNMKYADAFQKEVDMVDLFIYNDKGGFLQKQHIEGAELKENNVRLNLDPGTYYLVSWAGLVDTSYSYTQPILDTPIEDLKVRTLREAQSRLQDNALHPLWHSLDTIQITGTEHGEKVISLFKNTNKVRIVLQRDSSQSLDVKDFTFAIYADNGYMDYRNLLLEDDTILYSPYYLDNVEISADPSGTTHPSQTVAVAEMNTMQLHADRNYRLVVRYRHQKQDILNVNLNEYLALTKMESHDIGKQEYLERQDEYALVLFLTRWGCPTCPDPDPTPDPDPDPDPDPTPDPDPDPDPTPDPDPDPKPDYYYLCVGVKVNNWALLEPDHVEL